MPTNPNPIHKLQTFLSRYKHKMLDASKHISVEIRCLQLNLNDAKLIGIGF